MRSCCPTLLVLEMERFSMTYLLSHSDRIQTQVYTYLIHYYFLFELGQKQGVTTSEINSLSILPPMQSSGRREYYEIAQ